MLEKFYFESFLIAFSALIGALFSYVFSWAIERSGMDKPRKIVFLIVTFFITILIVGLVLWAVISFIGL
ncbi:MAG: hypothetical protein M0R03_21510 [Novosphingobium sp.]|nr:hypothetical protein [Novosphingobium sp.]